MRREIRLISCVGVRYDLAILPHFLRHYRDLGIEPSRMHIVLNALPEDEEALARGTAILNDHGVSPAELWVAPYTSGAMWEKRRAIQQRFAGPGDWIISADVDEFHEYPEELPAFLAFCERKGVNCAQGVFIDRLAAGGDLAPVAETPSIWEQFPVEADVACTLRRGQGRQWWYGTDNIMACRGDVLPSIGGHQPLPDGPPVAHLFDRRLVEFRGYTWPGFRFALPLRVHHFKWVDTMQTSVQQRLETPGASPVGSAYGRRVLDYLAREGRIALQDVPLRRPGPLDYVPWRTRVGALRMVSRMQRLAGTLRPRVAKWMP